MAGSCLIDRRDLSLRPGMTAVATITATERSDALLVGIGENAGVVDVGDGYAVTFKIESHNHPSYV